MLTMQNDHRHNYWYELLDYQTLKPIRSWNTYNEAMADLGVTLDMEGGQYFAVVLFTYNTTEGRQFGLQDSQIINAIYAWRTYGIK